MNNKTKLIQIRIDDKTATNLNNQSKCTGKSKSQIIRDLINQNVNNENISNPITLEEGIYFYKYWSDFELKQPNKTGYFYGFESTHHLAEFLKLTSLWLQDLYNIDNEMNDIIEDRVHNALLTTDIDHILELQQNLND